VQKFPHIRVIIRKQNLDRPRRHNELMACMEGS